MQPLDVGLFSPFKFGLKTASDDWMATHPGQRIRIDNIAPLYRHPYLMKLENVARPRMGVSRRK